MSEPLFTNVCIPDPPPKVTFEFIDVCDIPPPPPPIYDCSLPPVPPFDKPPPCPEIEPGIVTVTVDNRRSVCAPAAIPPGGRLKIRKDPEDCAFVFDLDIDVPVITPPCPEIRGGVVNVRTRTGNCDPGGENKITVKKGDPCDDVCDFEIDLDIVVDIPTPPCPKINGGSVTVRSGYGECGAIPGGTVIVTPKVTTDICGVEECEFDIDIDIEVPIPTPPCPKITSRYRTGKSPSLTTRVTGGDACDGDDCTIDIEIEFPEFPEPPCVPVFKPGSITVRESDNPASNNQFLIERIPNPSNPEECTYRPFGYIQIPKIPKMPEIPAWVRKTPNAPCIPTYTGGPVTGKRITGTITIAPPSAPPDEPETPEEPETPPEDCLGSCWILNQEPFNINTADPFGPVSTDVWGACYPMGTFASVTDARSCRQLGGGTYFSGNNCEDCPPLPIVPTPPPGGTPPAPPKPCSELQISAALDIEIPCVPIYSGGAIKVTTGPEPSGYITISSGSSSGGEFAPVPDPPNMPGEAQPRCRNVEPASGNLLCLPWPAPLTRDDCENALNNGGVGGVYFTSTVDCGTDLAAQCGEYTITGEIVCPEACVPEIYGGKVSVTFGDKSGGEITVGEPSESSCNSCFYPENSTGAILRLNGQVGVSVAEAYCGPADDAGSGDNSTLCRDRGGTCYPSKDCTRACKEFEIKAFVEIGREDICPEFSDGKITKKGGGDSGSSGGEEDNEIGTITIKPSGEAGEGCAFTVSAEIDMDALGAGSDCVPEGGEISVTIAEEGESGGGKIIISEGEQSGTKGSCKQGQSGECYPDYTRDECEASGGEWFPGDGCSKKSCGYTISADIKLPSELAEIEFEPAESVTLDAVECDEPASISVNIVKGEDGKYKIEVSGDYPDCSACCPVDSEVTLGPRREAMRRLDIGMGI